MSMNPNQAVLKPSLKDAIALARKAHQGKTDLAGAAYFGHLERVMGSAEGEDAKIVAILHDSVEDTIVTLDFLRDAGYPAHIVNAIDSLTKREEEKDDYDAFIRRVAPNPLARKVKLADLHDNSNPLRIKMLTPGSRKRMEKYHRAIMFLLGIKDE